MNQIVKRRIYHFSPPQHVLENIANRQLKVSRFSKCNDPFELAAFSLKNRSLRKRHKEWLDDMDKRFGLICFCRNWRNPVLWSHYADNHRGLGLGFDAYTNKFVDVKYASERLYPEINENNFFQYIGEEQMVDLFATKFIHWSYEEEVRILISFETSPKDNELCFFPFSDELRLRQVIIGARSNICVEDVHDAVGNNDVEVFQSRLGFKRFEIVRQKNKKLWNRRS